MTPLTELASPLFWRDPAAAYASMLAREGWLFANPHSNGLVAVRYRPIEELARHRDVEAVNRKNRGAVRAAEGPTSKMLSVHPNFLNEPSHGPARRQSFALLSSLGGAKTAALVQTICQTKAHNLAAGRRNMVADFTEKVASCLWSTLLTGDETQAEFLCANAKPIGRLMAFDTDAEDVAQADQSSQALLDWARAQSRFDHPDLVAAMTFDAVDGASAMTSNALWLLLSTPGLWAKLQADRSLVAPFASEAFRLVPSILGLERAPTRDLLIDGHEIPAGTNVLLLNAAGNRDASVFDRPDRINLGHPSLSPPSPLSPPPSPLSFGFGARACAGRLVTRLVVEAAVNALLDRCHGMEIVQPIDWGPAGQLRTVQSLWCELHSRRL